MSRRRRGSAFVLALAVLLGCASTAALVQQSLHSRAVELRIATNHAELRAALLLALREAMRRYAADDDRAFDSPADPWMAPWEARTDSDCLLRVRLACAQDRFNLNNLTLPTNGLLPRGPWDIFADLLASRESPPPAALARALREAAAVTPPTWVDPSELGPQLDGPELIALPRSATAPSPLNLNTVRPAVLHALVGDSLSAWADTVLSARDHEPLRGTGGLLSTLPAPAAALLAPFVGVRSDLVEFKGEAERDHTLMTLRAYLRRTENGGIEVLSCRW